MSAATTHAATMRGANMIGSTTNAYPTNAATTVGVSTPSASADTIGALRRLGKDEESLEGNRTIAQRAHSEGSLFDASQRLANLREAHHLSVSKAPGQTLVL